MSAKNKKISRRVNEFQRKSCIVIGASIGGLLAARVLADHFEQVTLIERDVFPQPGENRKGVPQGKHLHVLPALGKDIMESYLPGLENELARLGAVTIPDAGADVRWFNNGGYHQPGICGVSGVGVSRPTLEAAVRKHVLALPNVGALQGCSVSSLVSTEDNQRVIGVRVKNRRNGGIKERILADLVVDASGRGSRSPAWMEELGYPRPPEEAVHIGVGYTSRYYRRNSELLKGIKGIILTADPPNRRLGVMLEQDGDRWVVTLGGYLGDHAPTDPKGYLEFARSLPAPEIYNIVKYAEPLTDPVAYKFPAHLRRRYEKMDRFPQGYLVLGDALCSFNPIYGQGMTVAALESKALGEWLQGNNNHSAASFFTKTSRIIDSSWETAVGNDLRFPEVEGPRTPMVRFINWYIGKLHISAHRDKRVSRAFLRVINMVAPPTSILRPGIVWRVIRGNLRLGSQNIAVSQKAAGNRAQDLKEGQIGQYPPQSFGD
jgi:2-polyprenyl-6-methoxyphenol hydroxylase-like FAD-dependent oxidoreductase